jgi:hypothetical protein
MSRLQVWPLGEAVAEPPEQSYSALADAQTHAATRAETGANGDASSDSDTDEAGRMLGLEEGANAPLLPTESQATKKKKRSQKRVLVRGNRGQVMMRCGSIDDSLETSRKGLVRVSVSQPPSRAFPRYL